MDRGDWQAAVHGVAKESNKTSRLNSNNIADEIAVEITKKYIFFLASFYSYLVPKCHSTEPLITTAAVLEELSCSKS